MMLPRRPNESSAGTSTVPAPLTAKAPAPSWPGLLRSRVTLAPEWPLPSSSPPRARPIGRAIKGSLVTMRPDDWPRDRSRAGAGAGARARADEIEDSCSAARRPRTSRAATSARVVAVLLGLDTVPGHDREPLLRLEPADDPDGVPRDPGRRGRRVHLRPASRPSRRFATRAQRLACRTRRTRVRRRRGRAPRSAARAATEPVARPARGRSDPRRLHRDGPDRRERRAASAASAAREQDEFGVRSQQRAEAAIADGFWSARSRRSRSPTAPSSRADDGPRAGTTLREGRAARAGVPARRHRDRRQLLPAERRRRGGRRDERRAGRELGITPLARIVSTGVSALSPEIMGLGPVEASRQALAPGGHDDRRHRPRRDQRGVRGAGDPRRRGPRDRRGQAERARRRDRARASVRHDRSADRGRPCSTACARATRRSGSRRCASAAARAWR